METMSVLDHITKIAPEETLAFNNHHSEMTISEKEFIVALLEVTVDKLTEEYDIVVPKGEEFKQIITEILTGVRREFEI